MGEICSNERRSALVESFTHRRPSARAGPRRGAGDRGRGAGEAVRRPCRRPGALVPGAAWGGARAGGPQWRGQDDDHSKHRRDHHSHPRPDQHRRARPREGCGGGEIAARLHSRRAASVRLPHGRGTPPVRGPALPGGGHRAADSRPARRAGSLRQAIGAARGALARHEAEAGHRLRSAAPAARPAARRAAHGARSGRHPADEVHDRAARRGGGGGDPELAPAAPRRGDLHPRAGDERGPGGGLRHHRRHRGEPAGVERPAAGGRVPGADHAGQRAARVIRVFAYLAWRSAYNRLARQLRQLRSPRYLLALALGLSYLWLVAVEQRPRPAPASVAGSRWLELLGALGVLGAVLWGWVFGVERRVLSFTPAEVTFLFSGPVSRRGLVQYKLLRNQLLILFNSLLWTLILARERFGASPWLRALSIWVLLTTISFHRLGASFVRTSLMEHGRIGLRHRVVSLSIVGVALVGLVWSVQGAFPELAAGWAGGIATFLDALAQAAAQPVPRLLLAPFRAMVRPLAAHSFADWRLAMGPALLLLV